MPPSLKIVYQKADGPQVQERIPLSKQTVRKREEEGPSDEQTERQTTAPDTRQKTDEQAEPDRKRRRVESESPTLSEGSSSGKSRRQKLPKSQSKAEPEKKMSKAEKNQAKLSLSLTTERSLSQYFSPSRGKVGPTQAQGVGLSLAMESSSLICEGSSTNECIKASNVTSEAILCTNSTS